MKRNGMTLIELLVVVLIVGILAGIMGLRMQAATESARMATVRADLRAFAMAEEVFNARQNRYGAEADLTEFELSPGVEIDVAWSGTEGFAATAWHTSMADRECGVFMGPAPAGSAGPAVEAGVVTCE